LFDGTDDYLSTPALTLNCPTSLFVVAKVSTLSGEPTLINQQYGDTKKPFQHYFNSVGRLIDWRTDAYIPVTANTPFLLSEIHSAVTVLDMWESGNLGSRGTSAVGYAESLPIYIGLAQSFGTISQFSGHIAEIILIERAVSDTERQKIEGYLAHKWGLEANLPIDHTYKTDAPEIQSYSDVIEVYTDNSSPTYGNFSLRAETVISGSKTYGFEKEFTQDIALRDYNSLCFDTKSNRVGENVEFSMIVDTSTSGTQETVSKKIHHNDINIWQKEIIDFSSLFDTSLFYIRKISFNILNDDLDNTFYIDSMYLSDFQPPWEFTCTSWNKFKKLTIDSSKIDSDLLHFPIVISIDSSSGITDSDTTDIFDEVGDEYLKIAVKASDNSTHLYVEVEYWDSINKKALLWVSRDNWSISSSTDTDIYLYFGSEGPNNTDYVGTAGNRTEVWNSDFVSVYTLSQDPSGGTGCIIDSTSNTNNGTPQGTMTSDDLIDGDTGKAMDLDGADDYIDCGNDTSFDISSEITLCARVYPLDYVNYRGIISKNNTNSYTGHHYGLFVDGSAYRFVINGVYNLCTATVGSYPINNWYTVHGVYDGTGMYLYINGVLSDSYVMSVSINTNTDNLKLFNFYAQKPYYGKGESVYISSKGLNSGWVKADHHTRSDTLITFGPTETL
jgi:hypothetical protein